MKFLVDLIYKLRYRKEIKEDESYFARVERERKNDPLRIKIVESQHFGEKHWNVMIKRPGLDWYSTNDDYGWNSLEEAQAELERILKIARGEIIPYSQRVVTEVSVPQTELVEL